MLVCINCDRVHLYSFAVLVIEIMSEYVSVYRRLIVFFFFKQKTAYEMRISDWSSDVCSSDLGELADSEVQRQTRKKGDHGGCNTVAAHLGQYQIGRASCRERVCQYV